MIISTRNQIVDSMLQINFTCRKREDCFVRGFLPIRLGLMGKFLGGVRIGKK